MGIKTTQFFTIIFLLFGCKENTTKPVENALPLPTVTSIEDLNKIEIVTWNIERFPKTDDSDEYIKAIIEGLDADIYIVQEIQSRSAFANMLNELDGYNYFLQPNSTGLSLGIIYKDSLINLKSSSEILENDAHYFAGRPPLLTKVIWQGNGITKNISIINVHYKCCGNNIIDSGNAADEEYRRFKASEQLEKYVSDNLFEDNVLIGGDFNDAINEVDSTNVFLSFLNKPYIYKFVDMDIANGVKANWSWQGWSSSYSEIHFDHILINDNLFDEFENSAKVGVIKLEEYFENGIADYDSNVSDHRPVYFQFTP